MQINEVIRHNKHAYTWHLGQSKFSFHKLGLRLRFLLFFDKFPIKLI